MNYTTNDISAISNPAADIPGLIKDNGIHSSLYTDPNIFALEMDKIFQECWVFVGHLSEVPKRGDYIRRHIGCEPVLMFRTGDATATVLTNRCTHRGNLLCQEEKGRRRAITCQYHGWVFNLDGDLVDRPFSGGYCDKGGELDLRKAKVAIYRGFVFATFAKNPVSLEDHLGNGRHALDRASNLSPEGELDLFGGWTKHIFNSNWKMLVENNTDGYHVNHVHDSFARGIQVQYKYENVLKSEEDKLEAFVRDMGDGHAEIEYGQTYSKPLFWFGVEADRFPDYVSSMEAAYGKDEANDILTKGPPHTYIFPNLFIAEVSMVVIQPISAGKSINWNTPLYLKGAPDAVNRRMLRQGEAALGPSAFLLADDAVIGDRQWRALHGSPGWLDLSRGESRETVAADGTITSHYSDETPNRGFWRHYRTLFS
ncbi:MAG: ring-hydroxylating oxygenase subunit alpha [Sneathiella sp.]|uniref:aromatic ring-hydroxylating oxygenase subunit alpha n=1 Tax=Sneathiella sp. TaxID=1964365 RepID=UPI000C3A77C7|nr:Rieske 2Fe-2S domain-containing protein [Sneathiella sp.]MAZ01782.1 ring-hydroxylating oxygenase subunit alpha [Sneathiella sp.]